MNQSPFETIQSYEKEFTRTDRKISRYILKHPNEVIQYSLADLSRKIGVSDAAMIRFAKRIGYSGFSALKNDIARYIFSHNTDDDNSDEDHSNDSPLVSIPRQYARYISAISEMTDMKTVEHIADLYLNAKRVKIVGNNRTFHSVRQLRYRLNKIGCDAEAIEDMICYGDTCHYLGKDDLVMIFTTKNNMRYDQSAKVLHENKCHLVVFTMIQNLPYAKYCDEVVVLPRISRDSGFSFLDDQAIYFVFIEVLLDVIAKKLSQEESR